MKNVTIVTPCYNEEDNLEALHAAVVKIMSELPQYNYDHLFIDNASTDSSQRILAELAQKDPRVKVIINAKNFGHVRSPYHGLTQAKGDAVISLVADFQDPPDMIPQLLKAWEEGSRVVIAVKTKSRENPLMFAVRKLYYWIMASISNVDHIDNFTGFGLYDQKFIEVLREIDDPYPYLRGIVAEYAFDQKIIEYTQPKRLHGKSKNNFFTLFDFALLGMVNHTKLPLRIVTLSGFFLSFVTFIAGFYYLIYKLINWSSIELGFAPMLIGIFFIGSVQMMFIGIIGEYIGSIHTQTRHRPRVIEKKRINF